MLALQEAIRERDRDISTLKAKERALLEKAHESSLAPGLPGPTGGQVPRAKVEPSTPRARDAAEMDRGAGLQTAEDGAICSAIQADGAAAATVPMRGGKLREDAEVEVGGQVSYSKGGRAWELAGVRARLRERREKEDKEKGEVKEANADMQVGQELVVPAEGGGRKGKSDSWEAGAAPSERRESEDDGDVSVEEFGEDFMLDLLHHPTQVPALQRLASDSLAKQAGLQHGMEG